MTSLSIAMATYNGALHLGPQLASLAAQTRLPDELVVTDDGSTDDTLAILAAFAEKAPFPVHVSVNGERLGYRRNFMKAASLCRSELIAFCDQDDHWGPEKIERIVPLFDDPEVMLVSHNARLVRGGEVYGLVRPESEGNHYFPRLGSDPWAIYLGFTEIVRRELISLPLAQEESVDHYAPGEPLAHDQLAYFLGTVMGTVVNVGEALVDYLQHGDNTVGWKTGNRFIYAWRNLEHSARMSGRFADATVNRAGLLRKLAENPRLSPEQARRAREGAEYYERLSYWYGRRAGLYGETGLLKRLAILVRLLAAGAYRFKTPPGDERLTVQNLVKDLLIGLPLGPAVSRLNR